MASGQFRCANDDNWRVRRASAGRGLGSGSGVTHAETVVDASDTLTLISGRDTTLQGAQAFGEQVLANVGRDLSIVSEQDLDGYSSQQQQAGGTFVYGAGGSVSYGRERIDSRYRGVVEQSGIQAGEGGFDITVGGHTHLEGGAIASVADPSRNRLSTGSLTVESLQNDAAYRADSGGVSTGSWKDAGISAGASLAVGQREGADGLTRAGISDGTLEIRDGGTSALADLDRGVTELQGEAFAAIFDPQKVAERLEMGQVAGEVGFRAAGDLASSMGWPEGSKERTLLHGAVGAAMAALGGGDALEGLTGAVANQLVFNAVRGFLTDNAELAEGTAEFNALVQLASLAVGAVVGGQTGAATALSATKHNYLTHQDIELVEKALSACGGDDTCRQEVLEVARDISESKDYLVWSTCAENATSSDCQQHVQGASDYRYAVGLVIPPFLAVAKSGAMRPSPTSSLG